MGLIDSKDFLVEQLKTKTYLQLARELNVGKVTIYRKMKKFGLTTSASFWNKSEITFLNENYGSPSLLLKEFPNRTLSSIYHTANRIGLFRPFRRRYNLIDEGFFSNLTKESVYLLGWLYSDGNVTQDLRTFRFHLSGKDVEILEKMKKVLKSSHKITIRGKYVKFAVHSVKMCRDLVRLGCGPRKARKIVFPPGMSSNIVSHFVRGYFDGDGSIFFNYPNTIRIRFVGNQEFMKSLAEKVQMILKLRMYVRETVPPLWKAEVFGDNARKLCHWMYSGSGELKLDRKYLRFITHLNKRKEVIPTDVYSSNSD